MCEQPSISPLRQVWLGVTPGFKASGGHHHALARGGDGLATFVGFVRRAAESYLSRLGEMFGERERRAGAEEQKICECLVRELSETEPMGIRRRQGHAARAYASIKPGTKWA